MFRYFFLSFVFAMSNASAAEMLFIGNSMTLHGKNASLNWNGEWGMAASRAESDYVHLVKHSMEKKLNENIQSRVVNAVWIERNENDWQGKVNGLKNGDALDYVVIFLGDNVATNDEVDFIKRLSVLYTTLQQRHFRKLVIVGSWWPKPLNDDLERFALKNGVPFVSLSDLWPNKSLYASAERNIKNAGVGMHPGDKAMDIIHERIVAAILAK